MFVDGLKIEDMQTGMEFDFHTISSWSESLMVAKSFSPPNEHSGEGLSIVFSMKPIRGCNIASLSGFPSEKEFITGGKVKIVEINKRKTGLAIGGFIMECEQI
jgi:hypothetical protein